MIKIALVEDRPELRGQLAQQLGAHPELDLRLVAVHGRDFLEKMKALPAAERPELVLMDIEMGVMDGITATREALQHYPELQVVMLTIFDQDDKIFEAIRAGALGYLLKGEPFREIVKAIQEVHAGGSQMSPSIARKALRLLRQAPAEEQTEGSPQSIEAVLSPREAEVLEHLVQGMPLPVVAEKLFVSYGTVRTHVRRIYEKLQVSNKVEATQIAHKNRWFKRNK